MVKKLMPYIDNPDKPYKWRVFWSYLPDWIICIFLWVSLNSSERVPLPRPAPRSHRAVISAVTRASMPAMSSRAIASNREKNGLSHPSNNDGCTALAALSAAPLPLCCCCAVENGLGTAHPSTELPPCRVP